MASDIPAQRPRPLRSSGCLHPEEELANIPSR